MIQEAHNRDILASSARCLVNPVSSCGSGKLGLCALFLSKYPTMLSGYKGMCAQSAMRPGRLWMFQDPASGVWLANLSVREREGEPCQVEWIDMGISELARKVREFEIPSIAIPALGCDDGGEMEWHQVQAMVEKHFVRTRAEVILYPPCPPKGAARWSRR